MITIPCPKCAGRGYGNILGFTDEFTCQWCYGKGEVLANIVPNPHDRRFQEVSPRIERVWPRPYF